MKSTLLVGLVLVLLISVSFVCSAQEGEEIPFHDPIVITEDGDFTAANGVRGGTGTKDDPFITNDAKHAGEQVVIVCLHGDSTNGDVGRSQTPVTGVALV